MHIVSTPRDRNRKASFRPPAFRILAATIVVGALAGLIVVNPAQPAGSAVAAVSTVSEITVKWSGDSSAASSYQPSRIPSSPHFPEFKDISVTVSQTKGLIDQAIRVSVAGFAGTINSPDFGQNSKNYLQAMQCWGNDPTAADFRETCQWGGRGDSSGANTGLGTSVYPDNALRVSPKDNDPYAPTSFDVPFRTFDGQRVSAKTTLLDPDGTGPLTPVTRYEILDYFSPTTTNEVTSARVGTDGTGYFDFEVQTSDQAPQLGCGRATHLRCWLVIVPRGTVFGGDGAECSGLIDAANNYLPYENHRPNSFQGGSPINPKCDYWDNRIVVPLDFNQVGSTCAVGGTEQRIIGSQLMTNAMSSWQPALCTSLKTTFSFSTNPDSVARAQVLDGLAPLGFSGLPITSGELESEIERTLLANSKLVYAPVAISSVVVAFIAEFGDGRQESLVLSPRLVAKLLTQSYRFQVPYTSADPDKNVAHLPAKNISYRFLFQDPEFKALNPTNYFRFTLNPAVVLPGPSGADAIRQLWKWVVADDKAAAFLNGDADEYGMSVNPYYLPFGHPNATVPTFTEAGQFALNADGSQIRKAVGLKNIDGTPQYLSTAVIDTFPKADESKVPIKLSVEKYRFDTLQFSPYTDSLLSGARAAFRGNSNSKTVWDPNKINSAGEVGDWVSAGVQAPGNKFMITITDGPSAMRYGLSIASLQLADSSSVATASETAMTSALGALAATGLDSVKQVNPAAVTTGAYPLTIVTYGAVNLTKSTATGRTAIAGLLEQVTTNGQVSGSALGQLPAGYLPLTSGLTAEAKSTVAAIRAYVPPTTSTGTATNGIAQDTYFAGDLDSLSVGAADGTDPQVTTGAESGSELRTAASNTSPLLNGGLVIALVFGLAGVLFAPLIFRGSRPF